MPQHKSKAKRMRTSKKANLRNRMARTQMRSIMKNVLTVKDKEKGEELLKEAFSVLDRNVKNRIIHKNNAANKKAKLQRKISSLAK